MTQKRFSAPLFPTLRRLCATSPGLVLLATLLTAPAPAWADDPNATSPFTAQQRAEIVRIVRDALKSDPSILADAIVALRQAEQARETSDGIRAIQEYHDALFADASDPILGNPKGRITLIEFFDVRCPYCRKMRPSMDRLVANNPDLRIVMKDLPILGQASVLGAKALLAAQGQGAYGKLLDQLMRDGVTIDPDTIKQAATEDGLNWPQLSEAMQAATLQARLDHNIKLATLLGLHGTPAIIYGDQIAPGVLDYDDLQKIVDALRKS